MGTNQYRKFPPGTIMRLGNILLVKVNQEQPPEIHLPPDPCVQINIGKIITMPEIDDDLVTPVTTINLIKSIN